MQDSGGASSPSGGALSALEITMAKLGPAEVHAQSGKVGSGIETGVADSGPGAA